MNGIILVDKPTDWTSHDVVAKLRGVLRERRIGHSGTLDPMATGLLTVFVGRATRAVEFAETQEKEYIAGIRFGLTTDTQDVTGSVISETGRTVSLPELDAVLPRFTGSLMQIPPMYSAIKVNGQKLYTLARKGVEVERTPRPVTVFKLETAGESDGDFLLRIRCSKGTYIRTLCGDIGEALGTGAVMSSLRRTAAGEFGIDSAHTLEEIIDRAEKGEFDSFLLTTDSLFLDRPAFAADEAQRRRILCGGAFPADGRDGEYRVYSENGDFLMLGRLENGVMNTVKSFFEV